MLPEREPLSWSTRMQIALDSARGLEYIHEHTVPVYIHRDIKSENILLDKSFCAKVEAVLQILFFSLFFLLGLWCELFIIHFAPQVADFGLSKLADVGNSTSSTIVAEGTFGYMPPEYDLFLFNGLYFAVKYII